MEIALMRIFGTPVGNNAYIGRSTNEGMMDRNTVSGAVSGTVDQIGDTVVFKDTDTNPNLKIGIGYNHYNGNASMYISNSDEQPNDMGGEHVVQVSFPLPQMSEENAMKLRSEDLLNGATDVDQISVRDNGDGGYYVEVGDYGPGKVHNRFEMKDQGYIARARGGF